MIDGFWCPDGTTIAYQSADCRKFDFCVRRVRSGRGVSSITLEDAWEPAWKP